MAASSVADAKAKLSLPLGIRTLGGEEAVRSACEAAAVEFIGTRGDGPGSGKRLRHVLLPPQGPCLD